jgi:alkylhydroperoxidase family enzyme
MESDELASAVIADPRAVAERWSDERVRALAALARAVTEAPWTVSRALRGPLSDDEVLHAITLSAFFGHLNRIADVVDLPLDYDVQLEVPRADPTVPPWPMAPSLVANRPAIDLARRPETAHAFTTWRHYAFYARDTPLTRRQRTLIARWVATWLGDGGVSPPTDLTANPLDDAIRAAAEIVTLAPWRVSELAFARLRAAGFDDAAVFDVCATATAAGMFFRIDVALAALGR